MCKILSFIVIFVMILTGFTNATTESDYSQKEKLEQFIKDFNERKEGKVKVTVNVKSILAERDRRGLLNDISNDRPKGVIIYYLTSRYDEKAKEGWIEVEPVLDRFKQSQNNPISVIEDRQQCGSIKRDEGSGYYMLTECFHKWGYDLIPL